jgi:NET1-associated nuclear protein 1 (U3 small nucleolar RNA-associated protein 17)
MSTRCSRKMKSNVSMLFNAHVLMRYRFLIIAHRKSIKVYSTSNSLLNLEVNLHVGPGQKPPVRIVAYSLSPTDSNLLWVACSNGEIYRIDWTTGEGGNRPWTTSNGTSQMAVASMDLDGHKRDVVFTAGAKDGWHISAHELGRLGHSLTAQSRTIYSSSRPIQILKIAVEGGVIVAASEKRVLIGKLRSKVFESVDKIRYEFHVFESNDFILSMDFRVSKRNLTLPSKASKVEKASVVDVVVGDVKGAIFIHNDLLANLIRLGSKGEAPINLLPRKFHWHRTGVLTVKWSLDG